VTRLWGEGQGFDSQNRTFRTALRPADAYVQSVSDKGRQKNKAVTPESKVFMTWCLIMHRNLTQIVTIITSRQFSCQNSFILAHVFVACLCETLRIDKNRSQKSIQNTGKQTAKRDEDTNESLCTPTKTYGRVEKMEINDKPYISVVLPLRKSPHPPTLSIEQGAGWTNISLPGIEPQFLGRQARSLIIISTEPSWLPEEECK
jgi:hypothetical protein